jgi:hypothetical protein
LDESSSRPASRLSAQKKDKMGSAQVSKVFSVARQTSWSVHSYSRSSSPRARGSSVTVQQSLTISCASSSTGRMKAKNGLMCYSTIHYQWHLKALLRGKVAKSSGLDQLLYRFRAGTHEDSVAAGCMGDSFESWRQTVFFAYCGISPHSLQRSSNGTTIFGLQVKLSNNMVLVEDMQACIQCANVLRSHQHVSHISPYKITLPASSAPARMPD